MPSEVLVLIFGKLEDDVETLRTLRLTCSTFERAAWPAYASSFGDRIFHLTTASLRFLQFLAFNPAVAVYFKQLKISTVKLVQVGPRSTWATYHDECQELSEMLHQPGVVFPHNPSQLQWIKESEERARLVEMLRAALEKLRGLRRIAPVDDDIV